MKKIIPIFVVLFLAWGFSPAREPAKTELKTETPPPAPALDEAAQKQLQYLLKIPPLLKEIDDGAGSGRALRIPRRRAAKLFTAAADLAADPAQKEYLNALGRAVVTGDFDDATSLWTRLATQKVDVVVLPAKKGGREKSAIFIFTDCPTYGSRAQKYLALMDKMLEGLPRKDKLNIVGAASVNPIVPVDLVYPENYKRPVLALPGPPRFKVLVLRNKMADYYRKKVVPMVSRAFTPKDAEAVTLAAFMDNRILHRISHYLAPVFVTGKSEQPVLVKSALKDLFFDLEEIRADATAVLAGKLLLDEKLITEKEEQALYYTYVAGLLTDIADSGGGEAGNPAVLQIGYLLRYGGLLFDLGTKKFKLDIPILQGSLKKIVSAVTQVESAGDFDQARQFISGQSGDTGDELKEIFKRFKKNAAKSDPPAKEPPAATEDK